VRFAGQFVAAVQAEIAGVPVGLARREPEQAVELVVVAGLAAEVGILWEDRVDSATSAVARLPQIRRWRAHLNG